MLSESVLFVNNPCKMSYCVNINNKPIYDEVYNKSRTIVVEAQIEFNALVKRVLKIISECQSDLLLDCDKVNEIKTTIFDMEHKLYKGFHESDEYIFIILVIHNIFVMAIEDLSSKMIDNYKPRYATFSQEANDAEDDYDYEDDRDSVADYAEDWKRDPDYIQWLSEATWDY